MNYRPEIDGLRAVAVIPVVLYHAGFGLFSGGFVGVDVFFVISGYLITSLIVSEKQRGIFSLANFYERRARRILPALLLVMLASIPFAWQLLMPNEMKEFSESMVAVSTFCSNFFFWRRSGYFDISAELRPLLHTWSLAVEEQYYAIFPLCMVLLWPLGTKRMTQFTVAAVLLSFSFMLAVDATSSAAAFFLLPTRAWELLVGALIAFNHDVISAAKRPIINEIGAVLGVVLISYAVLMFDKTTPFPSAYTLAPVLGTALIVSCALPTTLIGRILKSRPFVGCGLISYSVYLWHQPLFAFLRHSGYAATGPVYLAISAISFALAYLTWRFVETPVRNKHLVSRSAIVSAITSVSIGLIAFGLAGHRSDGYELRLDEAQRGILAYDHYNHDKLYRAGKCFLEPNQKALSFPPECSADHPAEATIVWGDSHAAALSAGLRTLELDTSQYTASGCPPILGIAIEWRPNCRAVNEAVVARIHKTRPKRVLLHANWNLYAKEKAIQHLASTISEIQKISPATEIYVIGPVPQWPVSLPDFMVKHGVPLEGNVYATIPTLTAIRLVDAQLREIARGRNVRFVSAIDALCRNQQCLVTATDGVTQMPTAWDSGHLTQAGSLVLARRVLAVDSL
jgi:peptidoglycan/LPS O-acetylase OafA/YrhL